MSPRPRKPGYRDLEKNLYPVNRGPGAVYYQWRDPRNGKYHGMGKDKATANRDAKALNAAVYAELTNRHIDNVMKAKQSPTVTEGILVYWRIVKRTRDWAPNTERTRSNILTTVSEKLGKLRLDAVTVLDCAAVINGYIAQGKDRMAQSVRSALIDLFKVWASEGLVNDNPAERTLMPKATVKRSRLTIEDYWAIYGHAETWLQNAMLLALVTGQRREDVARMRFRDVKDGYLEVIQGKTDAGLKLGVGLELEGWTMEAVIGKCRDAVVSPFMVHHVRAYTKARKGDPVHKDTISRAFADARAASGLTWTKEPPTFHEIRSLSGRLHEKAGRDPKLILGHAEQKTTDMYLGTRGREWIVVG